MREDNIRKKFQIQPILITLCEKKRERDMAQFKRFTKETRVS